MQFTTCPLRYTLPPSSAGEWTLRGLSQCSGVLRDRLQPPVQSIHPADYAKHPAKPLDYTGAATKLCQLRPQR